MGGITPKTRHHSKTHTRDPSGIRVLRHRRLQNLSIIWQLKRGGQKYANDFHTACMRTLRVSSSYTQKAHSCIFFTMYFWYQKSLMIYKYACISVYSCTWACTRPSMTPRVSVVACVGLMECPKQKPPVGPDGQADLLNNTYKKSIHNLKFSPSILLLLFLSTLFFQWIYNTVRTSATKTGPVPGRQQEENGGRSKERSAWREQVPKAKSH